MATTAAVQKIHLNSIHKEAIRQSLKDDGEYPGDEEFESGYAANMKTKEGQKALMVCRMMMGKAIEESLSAACKTAEVRFDPLKDLHPIVNKDTILEVGDLVV